MITLRWRQFWIKKRFHSQSSQGQVAVRRKGRMRLTLENLEDRFLPAVTNFMAVGADAGGGPHVRVLDANGQERFSFMAYDPSFRGGVRVAVGDVFGTGMDAIVTAPGPGSAPDIRVFDGATGALLREFMAYDPGFTGGVFVAVADVNGDGYADIIVGAGAGGGPHVKVFSGKDGSQLASFFAYDPSFHGGVSVAADDLNGDGRADIITGPGFGGGPEVKVFSGADTSPLRDFMAYSPTFTGGVFVAAGDVRGTGTPDIVTGAGPGGGPHVEVFSGTDGSLAQSFFAYDASFRGGVRVSTGFLHQDQKADIFTAAGPGGGPHVRAFDGNTLQAADDFFAYAATFTGGVFVNGPCVKDADTVLAWNRVLLQTIRLESTQPPDAARAMAMVQAAVYDAVNSIDGSHQPYHVKVSAPANASLDAAAATAAQRVLASLYPDQLTRFNAVMTAQLAYLPDGSAKDTGANVGATVAANVIAWRKNDGASAVVPYVPGIAPGQYQLTPPGYKPSLDPQWPALTPFAMTNGAQFRPAGPPALNSAPYAADFNEVKSIGGTVSATRTPDQTLIAHFWADVPGNSVTPPGHWNEIAESASLQSGLSLVNNARLFALLNIALADAGIVSWDAKYAYNFWRPVTAIRDADPTTNPATTPDPAWTPLWATPPFPEYTSGHSTFSGAADAVLTALFGSNFGFSSASDDVPNVARTFSSFSQAADEAGKSRIYGGIHFQTANQDGLASGRALGNYVIKNFLN